MLTFNHQLAIEFEKLALAKIGSLSDDVTAGMLDDLSKYKSITGQIIGLKASLDLMSEAVSIVERKM
jgi:hypothetical protein